MNIKALQRRLSAFNVLRKPIDGEGDDLGGEVIAPEAGAGSDNGWNAPPGADEDRGDTVGDPPVAAAPAADPAAGTQGEGAGDPAQGGEVAANADEHAGEEQGGAKIPKARFDEVNGRRRTAEERVLALEAENAELRRQQEQRQAAAPAPTPAPAPATAAFNPEKAEQEYLQLVMNGELDQASQLRTKINNHLRDEAATLAEQRAEQRNAKVAMDGVITQALEDFPYLNTEAGQEALTLICGARDAYIAQGMPAAQALQKAVEKLAPKFKPEGDPPTPALPAGAGKTDTRAANAVERGLKASQAQPAQLQAGIGNRQSAGTVDVEALDDEQFKNLPEAQKARLRGDFV